MSRLFSFKDLNDLFKRISYGSDDLNIEKVVIDSREANRGSLFVPLVGEVTDGNLYIESALKNGCRCSLVSKAFYNINSSKIDELAREYEATFYLVDKGLEALHILAKEYIKRFSKLTVVGITGSSGKTSTKEVLGAILSSFKETLVTEGNYNSETGLPLTVFRIRDRHEFAVIEMGMSKPGEIKALVDIINPYASIITNIGRAHIGFFGSIDGIAQEKKDAFANFTGNNIGVVPKWDDFYSFLSQDVNGDIISVEDKPDYITDVKDLGFNGWEFLYEGIKVFYPYIGHYNLLNAFLAIACARELGTPAEAIVKGLQGVKSLFGRGEILMGKNRLIRDCYNANPDSTITSLKLLNKTDWSGKKVAILGDMLELGESSYEEHSKVLSFGRELGLSSIILYGSEYKCVYDSLEEKNGILFCEDMAGLIIAAKNLDLGSLVLLKGSRGVKLEDVTEYILN